MTESVEHKPILEARHISKSFSGPLVLKDVNFSISPGKVTALIGENGAGKSTLMKVLSGVHTDYEGQIMLQGKPIHFQNPRQAQQAGISIILQELNVLPNLTIAENIFLGREPETKLGTVNERRLNEDSEQYIEMLRMDVAPDTPVSSLKVAQQQLVEIAGALSYDAKILIMDEPTSALSDNEIEILFNIIREYKKQGGAVVYISHKLEELFEISDEIVVMRDGEIVDQGSTKTFNRDRIIKGMVGREARKAFSREKSQKGEEIFRVSNFELNLKRETGDCNIRNINFSVHSGEIVGIFGLMGAGRSELLEGVFGAFPKDSNGEIVIGGNRTSIFSVEQAIKAGIAMVPEDRKTQGLFLGMSVSKNLMMASLVSRFQGIFTPERQERKMVSDYIKKLNIDTPSPTKPINKLSGGNQQKVVISKWLATNPKILFLDEPTRGIDVNAKREVYDLINQLAEDGKGIVIVSSELPEILTLSDRILVLANGTISGRMDRSEATKEKIMHAAIPNR